MAPSVEVTSPKGASTPTTRVPVIAFVVSILAALGLTFVYWRGGQPQWEGALLCLSLGGIGVGVISWAHRFLPAGPDEEPREQVASSEAALAALDADLIAGEEEFGRRRLLVRLLAGAAGALGLAALFPIRSLGPRPGAGLKASPFTAGDHLINEQGDRVTPEDVAIDGFITVFPEDNLTDSNAPTLLIHTRPGQNVPRPGREDWAVDDLVAYSKICTHAGCPVGLYQAASGLLLCPCHQSTFDVGDGCRPVFGPATRSLPQLPLTLDDDGYLMASGDFSSPIGPGFWNQLR
jgi:ubiquinol-cytochrome c reductase iron-sulfur subunit